MQIYGKRIQNNAERPKAICSIVYHLSGHMSCLLLDKGFKSKEFSNSVLAVKWNFFLRHINKYIYAYHIYLYTIIYIHTHVECWYTYTCTYKISNVMCFFPSLFRSMSASCHAQHDAIKTHTEVVSAHQSSKISAVLLINSSNKYFWTNLKEQ